MPKVAMDYSKTVIYHFVCQDKTITCSYVGSTTNFVKRKNSHKSRCCNEGDKKNHFALYQTIRDNGGWTNWTMVPLEEFACENKTQQVIREQYWIHQLKPELNVRNAYQTEEELKECKKKYRETHKEELNITRQKYLETHKEQTKINDKKYRDSRKEERNAYNREYMKTYTRKLT